MYTDDDHERDHRRQDGDLAAGQVLNGLVLRLVQRVEEDTLHHRQHVIRGENDPACREDGHTWMDLEGTEKREELPDEPTSAR